MTIPSYLRAYAALYEQSPRAAAQRCFADAKYGLFLHYGLYSLLGRHEWVQLKERIPVAEYARLANRFVAEAFDAQAIVKLAIDAGMNYINLTTRHHDSFCLFQSEQTGFNSVKAPCGRDLVRELAAACDEAGLALFLYYSHGRDWRHPHAPNNDKWGGSARPDYEPPEPSYAYGAQHDLNRYLRFMKDQITELLTQSGHPVAGIWLDGIAVPLSRQDGAEVMQCQDLYDHIHALAPYTLVSYKQGLTHTEDFFAPEHNAVDSPGKLVEICTTMCPGSWGYHAAQSGAHLNADQVWRKLSEARALGCNLLLNTGPLPDGSLDPEDVVVLEAVGARIREEGFPGQKNEPVERVSA
jgi:alpha-L-fucosidase